MCPMRWVIVVLAVMSPVRSTAQVSVEIGPVVGFYRPLGGFDDASVYSTALPRTPEDLMGYAWGGGVRAWFGKRVGAEFDAMVAQSEVPEVFTPSGPRGPTPAQVTTFTAQGLLTVTGDPTGHQLWVSGGLGVVRHGGAAYDSYGTPRDLSPVAGIGTRVGLTRQLHATLAVNVLVYTFDVPMPPELQLNPGSLQHGQQVDVWTHLGVTWMIGRRGPQVARERRVPPDRRCC